LFVEIIQRVGCMLNDEEGKEYQKGGCGGFGKGNFSELFKSIEEYEKTLEAKRTTEPPAAAA
jgi:4-hydroxyphenylpyruvate dioxygenase